MSTLAEGVAYGELRQPPAKKARPLRDVAAMLPLTSDNMVWLQVFEFTLYISTIFMKPEPSHPPAKKATLLTEVDAIP